MKLGIWKYVPINKTETIQEHRRLYNWFHIFFKQKHASEYT